MNLSPADRRKRLNLRISSKERIIKGEDNQGNPIDHMGRLIVEDVKGIDEMKDEDFLNPTRTVGLPELPRKVSEAIGAEGRKLIFKRTVGRY